MKGCTDYTKEASGWSRHREQKSKVTRILVIIGIVSILAVSAFMILPKNQSESFSVDLSQDDQVPATQPAYASVPEKTQVLDEVTPEEEKTLVIYLTGAVMSQGVFELEQGTRVNDAVMSAGGLREDAASAYLNLAAPLGDGMHIHIPTLAEIESGEAATIEAADLKNASTNLDASESGSSESVQKVNINTANRTELESLPGVGTAIAQRILDYREKNGLYKSTEDLKNVSGIGDKKFAELADKVSI